jgi:putative zinc finger protein
MSDQRCDETRELLPEVALGIADGADRARVLEHVAACPDCRRELERQSELADGMLALAPEHEPPIGFEVAVLGSILPPAPRRRSLVRPLAVAAAVAAAVAITAGGMQLGFRDDVRLADEYREALGQANGTYFGARQLLDPAGRRGGVLFVYRGNPSWILVTVDSAHRETVTKAEIVGRDGRLIPLAAFRLADGAWGGALPVDLQEIAAVHLAGEDGRAVLVGGLGNPSDETRR